MHIGISKNQNIYLKQFKRQYPYASKKGKVDIQEKEHFTGSCVGK